MTERVIFRVNPSFYAAISEHADLANRSVNGEICTAVDKWLYERDSMLLVKDRLLASASEQTITQVRKATPSFLIEPDTIADSCKTTVRLKNSVAGDLRAAWDEHKKQAGRVSLNTFLKIVVAWWLTYSFQLSECTKAIHRDFMNSLRPSRHMSTANQQIVNLAIA